ncbi:uncharacterized protein LOC114306871 [Camellia sinensis]|uniref:uncharacterized protein LOC114306871 n=1 Tax=Camellia sinensis TaxID=4442 RepID=UPI00103666EB|nr:uncharacterized protein LOC114306871 [Camellia sinensis]
MSVVEYEAKFTELAQFASHIVDINYNKAWKFERGLNLDVFDQVSVLKLPMYVDVLDRTLMIEANLEAMKQTKAPTNEWRCKRSGFNFKKGCSFSMKKKQNTRSTSSSSQSSGSSPVCSECGRIHKGACYRATDACFRCDKVGHMVKDCEFIYENTNCPTASLAGSTSALRSNMRTNTGKETLKQGKVFALVPGDVQIANSVVSGMDWLTEYYTTINCVNKIVVFRPPGLPEFVICGNCFVPPPYLISSMKAKNLLRKGCRGYLCCVLNVTIDSANVDKIPIVNEFPVVFPNELPEDLKDRQIEFAIETWFGVKGKLAPRYIGPYEIIEKINPVTYQVALPPVMENMHNVFHISMLLDYLRDPLHVIELTHVLLKDDFTYEERPIQIVNR